MPLDHEPRTILGRMYEVKIGGPTMKGAGQFGRSRIIVEGVNHPKGEPIRFKSVERAENHLRNMRLGRE